MTVTLTYAADLARVRIDASALPLGTATADVRRSLDLVRWATVRGGIGVDVTAEAFARPVDDYEFADAVVNHYEVIAYDASGAELGREQTSTTPDLGGVPWLKVIAAPFLNRPTVVQDYSEVQRTARQAVFPVVGRALPVVVSDLSLGREFTLTLLTHTSEDAETARYAVSGGDVIFLHVPANCDVPGGYYAVGDAIESRPARYTERRLFALPVTEVDPPDGTVVGSTATWQVVVNAYATWGDLLAAHATWAEVLELVGAPGDVITG